MKKSFWMKHRVDLLKARWARGDSGAEIARALGCTRCQVMGKLDRLGLLGSISSAEHSKRISRANKRRWANADPATREAWRVAFSEAQQRFWEKASPEVRRARAERSRAAMARPEVREKHGKFMLDWWARKMATEAAASA